MGNESIKSLTLKNTYHDMTFKVVYGDIVESEKVAIVYAKSNRKYWTGGVGESLKRKGGCQLENSSRSAEVIDNALSVTTAPGIYMTDFIFHLDLMNIYDPNEWEQAIVKCLKEACRRNCDTVVFPALGTGLGSLKAEDMAKRFENAMYEFCRTGKGENTVAGVYIYVYQKDIFLKFKAVLREMAKWAKFPRAIFTSEMYYFTEVDDDPNSPHRFEPGQMNEWR